MSRKFLFLLVALFFGLNGCLYSCNYAPKSQSFKNTDPCDAGGKSQLVNFANVEGVSGAINFSTIFRLPCTGGNEKSFSLAFYDADHVEQPADLTSVKVKEWSFKGAKCENPADNDELIDIVNKNSDLIAVSNGSAITFGVGNHHPNRLYPSYIKISMSNSGALGTPHVSGEGACVNGVNMAPFVQNPSNLSPVSQKGHSVATESGEVTLDLYNYQLVTMSAPLFTYGVKMQPAGSEEGLISTPGGSASGSFFNFDVKMKPGRYLVVLSIVPSPVSALTGDFSLADVKIYGENAPNRILNYSSDCHKDVACQGQATTVTVR